MTHPPAEPQNVTRAVGRAGAATRYAAHLAPAVVVGLLLLGAIGGVPGGMLAIGLALIVPGWLVWKLLPPGLFPNDRPALPALWFVLSFTVLSPAIAAVVFVGWPVAFAEWYLLVLLVGLGIAAARVSPHQLEPWGRAGLGLAAVAAGAVGLRILTWHDSTDDLSYLGFMRRIAEDGSFPDVNPFLAGDVPLAPRWRLDGWTGLSGIMTHLGSADAVNVYLDMLPPLLVLVGASALFVLARILTDDRRFAHYAAVAGLIVPLLTSATGKTYFKYVYKSVAQNKYTALIAFLPVVAALLIAGYRSRRRAAVLLAAALWAMLFTHPVPAAFAVLVFGLYVLLDITVARDWARLGASAGLAAVMVLPFLFTAVAVSFTGEPFGTRLGDVEELSDIAAHTHDLGPVEIWQPRPQGGGLVAADPADATAYFVSGHAISAGPRVAFLGNGLPFAHWRMLRNPGNLMVALAMIVIALGRRKDAMALWLVAATVGALSVFVIPPFAALVARFITPWQLWRFSWLMPVPLATAWLAAYWLPRTRWKLTGAAALSVVLTFTVLVSGHRGLLRTGPAPSDVRVEEAVDELAGLGGTILAEAPLRNAISSEHGELDAVAYRGLATMGNSFPTDQRPDAFARIQDGRAFFAQRTSRTDRLEILERYEVDYVLVNKDAAPIVEPTELGLEPVRELRRDAVLYQRPGAAS